MNHPIEEISEKPNADTVHSVESMSGQDEAYEERDANYEITRAERIRRFYGLGGSSTNGSFRDDETASEGGASFDSEFEFNLRSVRSLAALGLGGDINRRSSYPSLSNIFNIGRSTSSKRKLPSNHISSVLQVLPDCFSQFADKTPHLADLAPPYRSLWMSLVTVESFLATPPYCRISTCVSATLPTLSLEGEDNPEDESKDANEPLTLQHVKDLTILAESLSALLKRHLDVQSLVLIPWIKRKANVPVIVHTARDRLYDRLQSLDSLLNQVFALLEILDSVQFSGPLKCNYTPNAEDMDGLFDIPTLGSTSDRDLDKFTPSPLSTNVPNIPPNQGRLPSHPEEALSASAESVATGPDTDSTDTFDATNGGSPAGTRTLPTEEAISRVVYSLRQLLRRVTLMTSELCAQSSSYLGEEYSSVTTFIEAHFSRKEWEGFAPYFWRAWCASEGAMEPLKDTEPSSSPMQIFAVKQPPLQPPLFRLDTPVMTDPLPTDTSSEHNAALDKGAHPSAVQNDDIDQGDYTGLEGEGEDGKGPSEGNDDGDSVATQPSGDDRPSDAVDAAAPVAGDASEPTNVDAAATEEDGPEPGDSLIGLNPTEANIMNSPLNLAIFCKNLQNDEDQLKREMSELNLDESEDTPAQEQGEGRGGLASERVLSDGAQAEKAEKAEKTSPVATSERPHRRSRAASLLATIKATFAHIPRPSLGLGTSQAGAAHVGAAHTDVSLMDASSPTSKGVGLTTPSGVAAQPSTWTSAESRSQPQDAAHATPHRAKDGVATAAVPERGSQSTSDRASEDAAKETPAELVKESGREKVTSITFPLPAEPKRAPLHPLKATKFDPNRHLKLLVPFFLQASKGHEEDKDWLLRRLPLTIPQRKLCLTEWVLLWEKEKEKVNNAST